MSNEQDQTTVKLQDLVGLMEEVHTDMVDVYRAYLKAKAKREKALKKRQEEEARREIAILMQKMKEG